MSQGLAHTSALCGAARDIGGSLVLCAATTAIGFFAFVPTDFVGVAELGLISGAGMFISLFCTVTILPALMSLSPVHPRPSPARAVNWSATGFAKLPLRNPRAVRASAIVLGVAAIVLLPDARFDNNPLHVRDPASESVRTFQDLIESGGGVPYSVNAVAPNLKAAESIAARLRELDEVGRVVTVSDFIPTDQETKLGIIEDVAMFIAPPPGRDGVTRVATPAQQVAAFEHLEAQLGRLVDQQPAGEVAESATRLRKALKSYRAHLRAIADPAAALAQLESSLIGSLPEQLRILEAALGAGRVTLENLPDALLERMVTAGGGVRIQIFPREELNDQASMAAFVDAVRTVTPEIAGSAAEIVESGRAVVSALRQALLSALVVITLFLLLLWRRIDDTALVLVPLALAAIFTVATAVLLDIPFNFADVIVLPLLLGIGVDSGIHLVHRARAAGTEGRDLLGTSTARAVVFSALTTIASFGTMGLATHLGLATLGRLLTIGVAFTALCNLILLPALIALRSTRAAGVREARRLA
jgi:hopanoid biosynthesis associated RND transporter like protein HpnN